MDKFLNKIILGDSLEVLRQIPDNSVDAVITDPPYASGGKIIWRGVVAWDKGLCARAPHKGYFRHQCEYIVWGTKGKCKKAVHAGPYAGCLRYQVMQKDKFHLTGKPTALMEELVKIVPEGGIILDPFVGSGTTAVAAKKQNRNFIGIEKTEVYYNIALNRLKEI